MSSPLERVLAVGVIFAVVVVIYAKTKRMEVREALNQLFSKFKGG